MEELQVENKAFFFDVGENPRGRFLKVSERGGPATRSLLIVPDGGNTNFGQGDTVHTLRSAGGVSGASCKT